VGHPVQPNTLGHICLQRIGLASAVGQHVRDLLSASQVQIPRCQTICGVAASALALRSERSVGSVAAFPPKDTEVPQGALTYSEVCLKDWGLKPLERGCVKH